ELSTLRSTEVPPGQGPEHNLAFQQILKEGPLVRDDGVLNVGLKRCAEAVPEQPAHQAALELLSQSRSRRHFTVLQDAEPKRDSWVVVETEITGFSTKRQTMMETPETRYVNRKHTCG
ncbi:unnamed protein product, partial [Ixodes pacificus]